jgi:hypothetical protein
MGAVRLRRTADRANTVVSDLAARVDGRAVDVSTRAAQTIAVAVRLLRIPTAVIGALSIPFIVLGAIAGGAVGVVILIAGIAMAIVNALFWARRGRVLAAVDDPAQLATELGIMLTMTGRVDEARGALTQIAGRGGWRVMGRLRGLWTGTQLTGKWIDDIGDLPRAKYFGPPKIGTTVSITFAALWLVPISIVVALFAAIGTLAGTL